jgi:hypothetical protein
MVDKKFILRPGISDAVCLGLLVAISLAGAVLEPSFRDFWLEFPLPAELLLACTALLLILSRSTAAAIIAVFLHIALLVGCALCLLLALFLMVTILFFGTAIGIAPPAIVVALNSMYTLTRIDHDRVALIRVRTT